MIGFNFQTNKITKGYDEELKFLIFDLEKDFLNEELNQAVENLLEAFKDIVAQMEPNKNYKIIFPIDCKIEEDDIASIFSIFITALKPKGPNGKKYMSVPNHLEGRVNGTQFSILRMSRLQYPYGVVQLELDLTEEGVVIPWVY